jgi:tetratricopeptide (TPR) repeat protein
MPRLARSQPDGASYAASVTEGADRALETAIGALRSAEWSTAATLFRAIVDEGEVGEAWFGLGVASWWQGDVTGSLECWERAHAAFRRAGDDAQAVVAAFYLCLSFRMSLGNEVAANGWLRQAMALIEEHDLSPVAGWVLLARAYTANDSHDPTEAANLARQAITLAKELRDRDLALCATCELGFALTALGDLDGGGSWRPPLVAPGTTWTPSCSSAAGRSPRAGGPPTSDGRRSG